MRPDKPQAPLLLILLSSIATVVGLYLLAQFALRYRQCGWDFPVFYIAGQMPFSRLYDPAAYAEYYRAHLQPLGVPHWAPYVRLSIFALPLRIFRFLPYFQALAIWFVAGLGCYLLAITLLLRELRASPLLFPVCVVYFPATFGVISGADNGFFALCMVLAFLAYRRQRSVMCAGFITICLCKFNLLVLMPILLIRQKQSRILLLWAAFSVPVLAASFALTSIPSYIAIAKAAPAIAGGFLPVGLNGFADAVHLQILYLPLAVVTIAWGSWLFPRLDASCAFGAALVGGLMVTPYVTWYDSTLLIVPLLIVVQQWKKGRYITACTIAALPIWVHRVGNNGHISFMHIGVEVSLMLWFTHHALPAKIPLRLPLLDETEALA